MFTPSFNATILIFILCKNRAIEVKEGDHELQKKYYKKRDKILPLKTKYYEKGLRQL